MDSLLNLIMDMVIKVVGAERDFLMLKEYFSATAKIIFGNQGTLDKFIGDCIMAVFGAPIFTPYPA